MKTGDSSFDSRDRGDRNGAIEEAAAQWVDRSDAGLDASGDQELAEWRANDPRHERAFRRLSAMSDALRRAQRSGANRVVAAELELLAGRRRTRRRALAGVGLAAILLLTLGGWWRLAPRPRPDAESRGDVAAGSIQKLPDGSIVELNGPAQIVVKFEPAFRRVELVRGEALFSVTKDPNRPFIVRAGGVEVRAVGTAFNVRLENAGVEVLVTEGKVRLDDAIAGESLLARAANGEPGTLAAGQRAVVTRGPVTAAHVSRLTSEQIAAHLAWHRPRVDYAGASLAQAVEQFNRANRIQVSLASDALGELRISGPFFTDDPETFSRLVAATFGLEVENRGTDMLVLKPAAAPSR